MSPAQFLEWYTDDEKAVQNVINEIYPGVNILLCWFHINKNIVKSVAKNKLSKFLRRCTKEEEFYISGQIKKILVLPFLPENSITAAYTVIKNNIMEFIKKKCGFFEKSFEKFFIYLDKYYFGNTSKIPLICKYEKTIRTTNLIEAAHSAFKKSRLLPHNSKLERLIDGKIKNICH